jgi:hypothetical protein
MILAVPVIVIVTVMELSTHRAASELRRLSDLLDHFGNHERKGFKYTRPSVWVCDSAHLDP